MLEDSDYYFMSKVEELTKDNDFFMEKLETLDRAMSYAETKEITVSRAFLSKLNAHLYKLKDYIK